MYRIFLVEDDFALADAMKVQLESYGNEVRVVKNFHEITEEFSAFNPHLVLMDIMLPFRDGYYWCGEIRRISSVPIVFISSASDNMNIVMAINMGGDDFIPKPVEPMVLNAKVQAILRRTYEMKGSSNGIMFGDAMLNLSDSTVNCGEKSVELTKNEFKILQVLLENKGKIVSRDSLMMSLWQSDIYVEENTLTVNVGRLRKKLAEIGLSDVIITKPGSGYIVQ
ncbi:MAG: response regulator transcription factor [Clostridia bacterium]|nr:response regulator transcription factor [Clostridia bacterium]